MTDFPIGIDPQGRIQLVAVQVRAAGVPDFLNRWLTLTPAELAERDAVLAQIVKDYRNRRTTMKPPVPGSKEAQTRALREERVKKPAAEKASTLKQLTETAPVKPAAALIDQPVAPAPVKRKKEKAVKTKSAKKPKTSKAPSKGAGKAAGASARRKAGRKGPARAAAPKAAVAGARARYDWNRAEEAAKAGKVPPMPEFSSYGPHAQKFYELAKKGDVKGINDYSATFKDETGGRANMFRFRDLCLVALKAK